MKAHELFKIRPTGVLIEDGKILIIQQKVNEDRLWSLPGGKLEHGETLEGALIREIKEETGLDAEVIKLLYVCEKPDANPPLIHIAFLPKKISGNITLPTNELESTLIYDVKMVKVCELMDYSFTEKFMSVVKADFSNAGSYMGLKSEIGL